MDLELGEALLFYYLIPNMPNAMPGQTLVALHGAPLS
jgi:hypothetical protein